MFTAVVLVLAYLVVPPLEVLLSGRSSRSRRANLAMIAPTMVTAGLIGVALAGVAAYGHAHGVGLAPWLGLPHAIELALIVALLDLCRSSVRCRRRCHGGPARRSLRRVG